MTKRIVLCADDYGQAPEISQGILSLAKYGRISAISCLTNTPYWQEHAKWLLPLQKQVDLGLHFNLTEGKPLSPEWAGEHENHPSLSVLLRKAVMGQLNQKAIEAELSAQITQFKAKVGVLPAFIDGHQHIHQFPLIRDALLNVYEQQFKGNERPHIRLVNPDIAAADFVNNLKKVIIVMTGVGFKKRLKSEAIPFNPSFSGIYHFNQAASYRDHFIQFLKGSCDRGLVMCHPGLKSTNSTDSIGYARNIEYQYLFGDQFLYDCHQQRVVLSRFA